MTASAIRLDQVTKRFDGSDTDAVSGLSLDIPAGSIIALIGPSGCGKTTTLRMINRLTEPTSGRLEINGRDVLDQPITELRRGIGYVIQQVGLFPHRTIGQNIGTVPRTLGWEKGRTAERVAELAELVGLEPEMIDRYPDELSGGQQQRVGVARALAADPPVLLMDEPFGAVDPIVRGRLQDELLTLQEKVRKTIVFVTHDIEEALRLGDRIVLLNVGGVLEQYATADELLRAPANEFVEQFVGEDRGMKRLALRTVADLPFVQGPVVDIGAGTTDALAAADAEGVDWVGVVRDGVFAGWVRRADVADGTALADASMRQPAAQVTPDSTLKSAMELIITSKTSVAVVNDDGRFGGVVTIESIRRSLEEDLDR
ncbi:MAG: betaine/proline/choline family ABC transporter ATP-binding protein [Acidimicrobiales bacterium]